MNRSSMLSITMAATFMLFGCKSFDQCRHTTEDLRSRQINAVCVVRPTKGNHCSGVVRFTQSGERVIVTADIDGLSPMTQHAIHIHTFGDASSGDGKSAGGHYNPEKHQHGLPHAPTRHAGDLGNLEADSNGTAHYEILVSNITIQGSKNPILGRAIIIHAKRDTGGQPTGEAGERIGCGVIGIAK